MNQKSLALTGRPGTHGSGAWRLLAGAALLAGLVSADQMLWPRAGLMRFIGREEGLAEPLDSAIAVHVVPEVTRADLMKELAAAADLAAYGPLAMRLHRHLGEMGLAEQQVENLNEFVERYGGERDKNVIDAYCFLIEKAASSRDQARTRRLVEGLRPLAEGPKLDLKLVEAVLKWCELAGLDDLTLVFAEQALAAPDLPRPRQLQLSRRLAELYERQGLADKARPLREFVAQDEKLQKIQNLHKAVMAGFKGKQYPSAEQACRELAALLPEDSNPPYNLACALARQGRTSDALASLARAVDLGFHDYVLIRQDPDLESLRAEAAFEDLVNRARTATREGEYEKAEPIAGLRTVERFPENGYRYRLRLSPEASPEKPQRLVVWLHPPRTSGSELIEPHARRLCAAGYALMILTQKNFGIWPEEEVVRLFEGTLPDLAGVAGIDSSRPILMGYGYGGQAAFIAWEKYPERVGGLVVAAAYPIDREKIAANKFALGKPPAADAIRTTPVYAVLGAKDPGERFWQREVIPAWKKAGIPLTYSTSPGLNAEWAIIGDSMEPLFAWLEEVAAGRLPSSANGKPAKGRAGKKSKGGQNR